MTRRIDPPEADREIRAFLAENALVAHPMAADLDEIPGGVSCQVVGVEDAGARMVVKRSLPQLRVASEWLAKQERLLTEVRAIELLRGFTPGRLPTVLAVDPERFLFAMERAPADWVSWKDELLAGRVDVHVARDLGRVLGTWHARTFHNAHVQQLFKDYEAFDQLRLDPFYRTSAAALPTLAETILGCLDQMGERRVCLVHGDYSPKNVLVGDGRSWVLDHEVAHFGDPVFDVAFMLHHLLLKAIHLPGQRPALERCSMQFLEAYQTEMRAQPPDEAYLAAQTACLMLARVYGKSPAGYLTASDRRRTSALGIGLLAEAPGSISEVWGRMPLWIDADA